MMTTDDLDEIFVSYLATAIWSGSDTWDGEDEPRPLDEDYDADDIADEASSALFSELCDFLAGARSDDLALLTNGQIGHDFCLTRNGHGAGFWDRGLGEAGLRLTDWAKTFGESDLYAGDDGQLYV